MQATINPGASAPTVFNFRTTEVRTLIINGDVWFVASDVAKALGHCDARHMTRILDEDEQGLHNVETLGGPQSVTVISESGLYHAVLKSRKPEAKPFRRWVTSEVLPAIRKTGRYALRPELPAPKPQPRGIAPVDLRLLRKQLREIAAVVVPERVARFVTDAEHRILIDCGIRSWHEGDTAVLLYARSFVNDLRNKAIDMKTDQQALESRYWLWFFQPGRLALPEVRSLPPVVIDAGSWFPRPL